MLFSSRNQPAGHFFFLKSPITPSKVKWSAPKIYQTFGQLTDPDLSIISKGFWNNRRLNSQGRGEEFVSTYPYQESPYGRTDGRTYGDVITKFSRMDSLPNFINHGARCACFPRGGSAMKYRPSVCLSKKVCCGLCRMKCCHGGSVARGTASFSCSSLCPVYLKRGISANICFCFRFS